MIRNYPGAFTSEEKMQINRIKNWIAEVKQLNGSWVQNVQITQYAAVNQEGALINISKIFIIDVTFPNPLVVLEIPKALHMIEEADIWRRVRLITGNRVA